MQSLKAINQFRFGSGTHQLRAGSGFGDLGSNRQMNASIYTSFGSLIVVVPPVCGRGTGLTRIDDLELGTGVIATGRGAAWIGCARLNCLPTVATRVDAILGCSTGSVLEGTARPVATWLGRGLPSRAIAARRASARAITTAAGWGRAIGVWLIARAAGRKPRLAPGLPAANCRTVMLRASTSPSTYAVHSPVGGVAPSESTRPGS